MKSSFTLGAFALCFAALNLGCSSNAENAGSTPAPATTSTQQQGELQVGDAAPAFSLRDQDNKEHRLEDFRGKAVVLAFYPADMTKGCTLQAHKLSTIAADLEKRGVKLFGVSVQDVDSKKQFCDKEGIKYSLLADTAKAASRAYGVLQPSGVSSRTTFVIAPDGKIGAIQKNVSPATADKDTLQLATGVLKEEAPKESKAGAESTQAAAKPEIVPVSAAELKKEIASRQGKVLVVNFWATWCDPCLRELPSLVQLRREYSGKGLDVLFVSADEKEELNRKIPRVLGQQKIDGTTWIINEDEEAFANAFDPKLNGVLSLPHTYIYDKSGKLIHVIDEEKNYAEFQKLIAPLL